MARPIDIEKRIAALSPDMREQLRRRLAGEGPSDSLSISIPRRPDKNVAPLSYAQERLWFLSRLEPESPVNNRPFALRHRGPLEAGILERVLCKIIERHEILCTTVFEKAGIPVQKIAAAWSVRLMEKDFSKILPSEKSELVDAFIVAETRKPFDLAVGPLLRATLLRLDTHDHVLLVVVHHMLFDGWSAKVFADEIETLYTGYVENKAPSLPDLPIQYADYAHWQRAAFDSGRMTNHLNYWEKTLKNAPPELALPKSRPKVGAQAWEGVQRSCLLPSALTASLRNLGNRDGATLFMVLLAAFNALLYRYSNQEDIVVGVPVAGRTAPKTENLIGFFVNTLALRNDLSGNPSFRQFLGRVKQTVLDAISHQETPFEKVISQLNPDRVLNRSPLFQVWFNFENFPRRGDQAGTPAWEELEFDPGVAPFAIDLEISEKGGGLSCKLTVNRAIFDVETAERMLGHYATLLAGIAEAPDQLLSDLPLMTEPECRRIAEEWNRIGRVYSPDRCIHRLFEEQAARNPEGTAVSFGNCHLTYGELNTRANRLAHFLIRLGVGPDLRVAMGMERGIELIVGMLAVLKAGGAYVPLDPEYPDDRLSHMLNDCAPVALLTQAGLKEKWKRFGPGIQVIELDSDTELWSGCSSANPGAGEPGLISQHLAYVIYTSGSTGTPKGVMVTHHNVVRLFKATEAWFSFNDRDVWTLFHSYAFDFSVWEIWGALLYGGRLVVVPRDTSRSPQDFYSLLCREKVTILNQTPGAFRQLAAAQAGTPQAHFLRKVIFGGEALDVSTLRPWYERNDPRNTELVNMYGITETTVHTTYRPLQPADVDHRGGSPIGVRIPDLRIYILDPRGNPVPVGITGELYVGGSGVARGYLNLPELTAERFITDPFSGRTDARIYKTGDLGRWLPDGSIEYLGRNDFQVKIRGFRIELGEIEACLRSVAGIREAVVLAREDRPGERRLVAYYTLKDTAEAPALDTLRGCLASRLPDYMLPSAYVAMEHFPLTPNGKTDCKAFPAPEAKAYATRTYEPPAGEREEILAKVWSELLGVDRIGRRDHFFELGGHSLMATRIISRLLRDHGITIPLRAMFEHPTISSLAMHIHQIKTLSRQIQSVHHSSSGPREEVTF